MSNFQPYKYRATGVGTFQVEGPGIEKCAPIWDHEDDAARCVLAMNNAWHASRKHAVDFLEARSRHFHKYSLTHSLSEDARSRCALQSQCLRAEAVSVGKWDVLETPSWPAALPAEAAKASIMCSDCGELHVTREDCPSARHWTDCPKCFQRNGPDTDDCVAFHCSGCGHDYVPKLPTDDAPHINGSDKLCWRCGHFNRAGDVCPC
jgi:hypothetical protein